MFSRRDTGALRRGVGVVVLVSVAALALWAATGAFADDATTQAILLPDGSGSIIANATNNPSRTWSWDVCAPDGTGCTPFGSEQQITTAGAPADVVFEAIASDGPNSTSPVWHGTVSPETPPSVSGLIQANDLVAPVAGTWSGGWDGDYDIFQLAACQSADGSDCTTLTDAGYVDGCPNSAAVIDPAFTGDYLRVADMRVAAETAFGGVGRITPYGSDVWAAGPTISVAVVGQIAAAIGPRQASCGPPPLDGSAAPAPTQQGPTPSTGPSGASAPPTSRSTASLSKTGLARISCANACAIELTASHGRRAVHMRRTLGAASQITLQIPISKLRRLGHGRTTFTVTIDGAPAATRSIRPR